MLLFPGFLMNSAVSKVYSFLYILLYPGFPIFTPVSMVFRVYSCI